MSKKKQPMTHSRLKSMVQSFLNDKAATNRLIGYTEEHTMDDVVNCSNLALLEINNKGIIGSAYTMETCDEYLLLYGTAKYLLAQTIAEKTRNFININDGGVSTNREGNISLYQQLYESIRGEFEDQLDIKKCNLNLTRAMRTASNG